MTYCGAAKQSDCKRDLMEAGRDCHPSFCPPTPSAPDGHGGRPSAWHGAQRDAQEGRLIVSRRHSRGKGLRCMIWWVN